MGDKRRREEMAVRLDAQAIEIEGLKAKVAQLESAVNALVADATKN